MSPQAEHLPFGNVNVTLHSKVSCPDFKTLGNDSDQISLRPVFRADYMQLERSSFLGYPNTMDLTAKTTRSA